MPFENFCGNNLLSGTLALSCAILWSWQQSQLGKDCGYAIQTPVAFGYQIAINYPSNSKEIPCKYQMDTKTIPDK